MEELVKFIAKSLVDDPDSVTTTVTESDSTVTIELRVAPDDMGKVIGKTGPNRQGYPDGGESSFGS